MKLVCSQSDLYNALSLSCRCVPSRPSHPILGNLLLVARDGYLHVTGFDLTLGIRTKLMASVLKEGEIAVPAKLLLDICGKLPTGDVVLSLLDDGVDERSLSIKTDTTGGNFTIRCVSANEYVEFPIIDSDEIVVPAGTLQEGISKTIFSASGDETKQVLTGVRIHFAIDKIEFASTDGHRLSVVTLSSDRDVPEMGLTIPSRSLAELQRLLAKQEAVMPVTITYDDGRVMFVGNDYTLVSRTLEGNYPAYNQLIPRQFERMITVERKQLLACLDRISTVADTKNHIVKVEVNQIEQQITLSCEAPDVGSGYESISAQVTGENITLAFNVKYLTEGIKQLASTEVMINLNQPLTPAILTPLGGTKMIYLAMPVQIRD